MRRSRRAQHFDDDNARRGLSGSAFLFDIFETEESNVRVSICSQCQMPMRGDICVFCGHVSETTLNEYDDTDSAGTFGGLSSMSRLDRIRGPIREQSMDADGNTVDQQDPLQDSSNQVREKRLHMQRMLLNDSAFSKKMDRVVDRRYTSGMRIVDEAEANAFFDGLIVERQKGRMRRRNEERMEWQSQEQYPSSQYSINSSNWFSLASQQTYIPTLSQGTDTYVSSVEESMLLVRNTERVEIPDSVMHRLRHRLEMESQYGDPLPPRNFHWLNNHDVFTGMNLWSQAKDLGIDIGSQNIVDILISNRVLSFLYCYQTVLMVMVQDLVDRLRFPPVTVQIMQQLWQRYLDQFDPVAASNVWIFRVRDSEVISDLIPHAEDMLAFCYLACLLSGKTVLLADIIRWTQSGILAYRNICPMLEQNVPLWKSCARRCMCFSALESPYSVNVRHESGYKKHFLLSTDLQFYHIMALKPLPTITTLWGRVSNLHTCLYPDNNRGRIIDSDGLLHILCREVLCLPRCTLRDSIVSLTYNLIYSIKRDGRPSALPLITFKENNPPEQLIAAAIIFTLQLFLRLDMEEQDCRARAVWHEIVTRMVSVSHTRRMERGDCIAEIYRPSHGLRKYARLDDQYLKDIENLGKEFTFATIHSVRYRNRVLESFSKAILGTDSDNVTVSRQNRRHGTTHPHQHLGPRWWLGANRPPIVTTSSSCAASEQLINHPHDMRSFDRQDLLLLKPNLELYNTEGLGEDLLAMDLRTIARMQERPMKLQHTWQSSTNVWNLPLQLGFLVESMAHRIRIPPRILAGHLALLMNSQLNIENSLTQTAVLPHSVCMT